jgi:hypothetical protein
MRLLSFRCFLLVLLFGADSNAQQVIDQRALEDVKVGEIARLDGRLKKPAETICVLQPYQDSLREEGPLGRLVNAHLAATKYSADKGHWAFVFVDGDAVSVLRFPRSERFDMSTGDASLPSLRSRAAECAPAARAGLWKGKGFSNRDVVVFGEVR